MVWARLVFGRIPVCRVNDSPARITKPRTVAKLRAIVGGAYQVGSPLQVPLHWQFINAVKRVARLPGRKRHEDQCS